MRVECWLAVRNRQGPLPAPPLYSLVPRFPCLGPLSPATAKKAAEGEGLPMYLSSKLQRTLKSTASHPATVPTATSPPPPPSLEMAEAALSPHGPCSPRPPGGKGDPESQLSKTQCVLGKVSVRPGQGSGAPEGPDPLPSPSLGGSRCWGVWASLCNLVPLGMSKAGPGQKILAPRKAQLV